MQLTKCKQWQLVGGLSTPSKMPCYGYSLPAYACKVGAKLRKIKGSTCERCYATRSKYCFPCSKNAMSKRLLSIESPEWVDSMIYLIGRQPIPYFRWHDSGDLQSKGHLNKIIKIAKALPHVKFWLPTKEVAMIKGAKFPPNLTVRISGAMIDRVPAMEKGRVYSTVYSTNIPRGAFPCYSVVNDGKCGTCRACWDSKVKLVAYKKH